MAVVRVPIIIRDRSYIPGPGFALIRNKKGEELVYAVATHTLFYRDHFRPDGWANRRANAGSSNTADELKKLREAITGQQQAMAAQQKAMAEQQKQIAAQQRELERPSRPVVSRTRAVPSRDK